MCPVGAALSSVAGFPSQNVTCQDTFGRVERKSVTQPLPWRIGARNEPVSLIERVTFATNASRSGLKLTMAVTLRTDMAKLEQEAADLHWFLDEMVKLPVAQTEMVN